MFAAGACQYSSHITFSKNTLIKMPLNLNINVNIPRKKLNKPLVLKKMSNFCVIVPALSHADDAVAAFAQTAVVLKQS